MRYVLFSFVLFFILFFSHFSFAITSVCVNVKTESWSEGNQSASSKSTERDPYEINPALFLERHIRYEITHEVNFQAVDTKCTETMTVELYPLPIGWTVFARYSGHAREEKIDQVEMEEFLSLAQRLTWALLRNTSVQETMNRKNVLRADSQTNLRTVKGTSHFILGLGTLIKSGELSTVDQQKVTEQYRILTPISLQLSYRNKYESWGLDFFFRGAVGSNRRSPRENTKGGHADFDANASMGLHLLKYTDPTGITSFYYGGGAQFEATRYSIIQAEGNRASNAREFLYNGGLSFDLMIGYEFLRASSSHIFVQAELQSPLYMIDASVTAGRIRSYFFGGLLQIGMIF